MVTVDALLEHDVGGRSLLTFRSSACSQKRWGCSTAWRRVKTKHSVKKTHTVVLASVQQGPQWKNWLTGGSDGTTDTVDGGEGGSREVKTCSCGSICSVFVKTCSCGSIRNVFVQVRHAQLAPVPPMRGAHETGDLGSAGPRDGGQVMNPAAAGGAQVPSRDSPRGAPPTLSDSGCPPVKVLKSQSSVSANALVGVRRSRSSIG